MRSTRVGLPAVVVLAGVAVVGAILGAGWDLLHVHTRTIIYSIGVDRQPLWVPLEFASVYVVGVAAIWRLGVRVDDASLKAVAFEASWVTVAYAFTAVAHSHEVVVALVLAASLVLRGRGFKALVRPNMVAAAALMIAGPVVEAVLIEAGLFRYTRASLGSVALWLPLLYANAVPFALTLAGAARERTSPAGR